MVSRRRSDIRRVQLHHPTCGDGGDDSTVHFLPVGAWDDSQADRAEDWPVGAHRWSTDTSGEGRHTDHGRCTHPRFGRHHHLAVGRFTQRLHLGGVAYHAGRGGDRLGGRLSQSGASQSRWLVRTCQDVLAIAHRVGGWHFFVDACHAACAYRTHRAVFQNLGVPAGHGRVHRAGLSHHRRQQQCGEPNRRTGWLGHHADGDGGECAGDLRLRRRSCRVLQISGRAIYPGCG